MQLNRQTVLSRHHCRRRCICAYIKGSQFWFRWKIRSENWYFFSQSDLSIFATIEAPIPKIFPKKIRLRVTSIDISSCWWRGHGEGCVTCHLSWGWFKLVWDWKVSWCCALCLDLVFYHIICWRCPRGAPEKNRKRTNFYRTLSNNFAIFFIGTIFHSDEKILIKKIASVLSQSDHSISIGFFIGIKIDYPYYCILRMRRYHRHNLRDRLAGEGQMEFFSCINWKRALPARAYIEVLKR
jgi:hypothetical protein